MSLCCNYPFLIFPLEKNRNSALLPPSDEFQSQQNDKGNIGAR